MTLPGPLVALVEAFRTRVLPPGLMDNYLADGILFHNGVALWEMPDQPVAGNGGGYNHALKMLRRDSSFYEDATDPGRRRRELIVPPGEIRIHYETLFTKHYSRLDLADFATVYGLGSSIALQNMVFAPVKGAGGVYTFYRYDDVHPIVQRASGLGQQVYANIGVNSQKVFWSNEYEFELRNAQVRRPGDREFWRFLFTPLGQSAMPGEILVWPMRLYPIEPDIRWHSWYPRGVLDVTRPNVFRLVLESVRDAVRRFPTVRFFLPGEHGLTVRPDRPCVPPVTAANCADCLGYTNFAPHVIRAFQMTLREWYGTVGELNRRWGLEGTRLELRSFSDVDAGLHLDCNILQAAEDFLVFRRLVAREVYVQHYTAAKEVRPEGVYGMMSWGGAGMEAAWLESDLASTADWLGGDESYFVSVVGQKLYHLACFARLGGKPTAFAISSPAVDGVLRAAGCFEPTQEEPRPPIFHPRCVSPGRFLLYFRDILTAGVSHIGYYKCPEFGFMDSPQSMQGLREALGTFQGLRSTHLGFMSPYQRIALHLDRVQAGRFIDEDRMARALVHWLEDHQYPYAMFLDERVLDRPFSREALQQGVTISPFHAGLREQGERLMEQYLRLVRSPPGEAPRRGAVVAITDEETYRRLRLPPDHEVEADTHPVLFTRWRRGFPCYLLVVRPQEPRGRTARLFLERELVPFLTALFDRGMDLPVRPFQVLPNPHGQIQPNFVTDGLNFLVAVSNKDAVGGPPVDVRLEVDPKLRGWFGGLVVGYLHEGTIGWTFPLGRLEPGETRLVYLAANVAGLGGVGRADIEGRLVRWERALRGMAGQGYQAEPGLRLVGSLRGILQSGPGVPFPERLLAGLAALARMVFVKAHRGDARRGEPPEHVHVEAVRLWPAGAARSGRVQEAEIQLLHVRNAHEEQQGGRLVGGRVRYQEDPAAGSPVLPYVAIQPVRQKRLDFVGTQQWFVPSFDRDAEPVEVHVHDQETGAHAFVPVA